MAMATRKAVSRPVGLHHLEAFLEMMSAERGASPHTLAAYRRDIEEYAGFLAGKGSDFEKAGAAEVRGYLSELDARGFAASSAARRLSAVRQFHRFLFSEGVRSDDPSGIVSAPKRRQPLPHILSEVEVDRLLALTGSDKSRLLSATIWLADVNDFAEMNSVWDAWVDKNNPPARATGEAKLAAPKYKVEIIITAAKA